MRKIQPCKICKFCIYFRITRGKKYTFDGEIIKTFARNTNIYKFRKLSGTIFSTFTTFGDPTLYNFLNEVVVESII